MIKETGNKQSTVRTIPVLHMSCASCAANVENKLSGQQGVISASVKLATSTVKIEYYKDEADIYSLRNLLQSSGYDMVLDEDNQDSSGTVNDMHASQYQDLRKRTLWAIILSIPVMITGMFFMNIPYANLIMWILTTPIVVWLGNSFYINAWKHARHGNANMDTLVALSTGVAYLFSVFNSIFPHVWHARGLEAHVYYEAAAVIIAFILLGRLLEEKARSNTSSAIKKLMGLQPREVTVVGDDGINRLIPVGQVKKGDILMVKPGEKIAVDGTVVSGSSWVDESMLSGEPVPLRKEADDDVYAGTINQKGSFRFRAAKVGGETMLAQIIRMVQEAQGSKAPVQKLVDRIAAIFVPVVMVIAVIAFVVWNIAGGENSFTQGLMAMITVLVIACPCALGLATPTAIMVGIGKGAGKGILIKDAISLETGRKINTVVLDKTGTITEGHPVVTDIKWLHGDEKEVGALVALERESEHPLAEAVVNYFHDTPKDIISDFESVTGRGIKGNVRGTTFMAGSRALLEENNIRTDDDLVTAASIYSSQAKTVIWFSDKERCLAVIAVADKIKAISHEAITRLQKMNIEVHMLTGDNEETAKAIAADAGVDSYRAGALPQEKSEYIKKLQASGKVVAMAGDGINDSAALAQADISIAMGKGSDIAIDVARITIVSSDLNRIADAVKLSKQTVTTIRQNLFWAFIYNIIGIPIAAGVLYPFTGFLLNPMIAGAAMALSSVSVVTNSLRLKLKR